MASALFLALMVFLPSARILENSSHRTVIEVDVREARKVFKELDLDDKDYFMASDADEALGLAEVVIDFCRGEMNGEG